MSKRSGRANTARETVALCAAGGYTAPSGRRVDVAHDLERAISRSVLYRPSDFQALLQSLDAGDSEAPRYSTEFHVQNGTTLEAARRLLAAGEDTDVLCLNFASAKNPGGGFLGGAQAQEESLARARGLYACLLPLREMYDVNRACGTCLYTDYMIWSPGVPVFRNDEDELLENPYRVTFLTAPAVNAGAIPEHSADRGRVARTMIDRIEKVLAVARSRGHDTLVLGAWGCGVFRNNTADVAEWFREHLCENPRFRGRFRRVTFAVLDHSAERSFVGPFEERFGRRA